MIFQKIFFSFDDEHTVFYDTFFKKDLPLKPALVHISLTCALDLFPNCRVN